jgi:hypothetical protein
VCLGPTKPIGPEVPEQNPPMRTDAVKRNATIVEQPHQIRPRYVQKLGRFLRGQFRVMWNETHCITASHFGENCHQKPECGGWNCHGFTAAARSHNAQLHRFVCLGELRRKLARRYACQLCFGFGSASQTVPIY